MKPRIIAAALLGSLVATLPAAADRRRNRGRVAEQSVDDEAVDQDGPEATAQLGVTIDELVAVAVRQSPDLARSRQDRESARGQAQAARKDQQWVVSAGSQLERFSLANDDEINKELRAFDTVAENKLSANLGIGRNLPTGGNIGLEFAVIRTARELAIPEGFLGEQQPDGTVAANEAGFAIDDTITTFQSQAKLTFRQPLARGFGSTVALAQEKKGDLAAAEATLKAQLAAEEMLRDIVIGYWELAFADYEVQTRAGSLLAARNQEKQTQKEFRADVAAQNAITAIQFEIATREDALLESKIQYEKKSLDLRRRVGLELSRRELVLRPMERFEPGDDEFDVDDVLRASKKGNRRVASLILAKRQADLDVKVAKNAMLPQVDLSLSGAVLGTGDTPDKAFTRATTGGYLVSAGLTVQFDVGGAAKGAHDAAIARRQRVAVDQADIERTVETEVVHAVHQATAARQRIALAARAVKLGEENIVAERANIQSGRSTMFNLMQRQSDLYNSKLRYGRAVADYHIAVAQVQFLGGTLLEQYDVSVRPVKRSKK
jgi:outer membrane protein TolC